MVTLTSIYFLVEYEFFYISKNKDFFYKKYLYHYSLLILWEPILLYVVKDNISEKIKVFSNNTPPKILDEQQNIHIMELLNSIEYYFNEAEIVNEIEFCKKITMFCGLVRIAKPYKLTIKDLNRFIKKFDHLRLERICIM